MAAIVLLLCGLDESALITVYSRFRILHINSDRLLNSRHYSLTSFRKPFALACL